MKEKYDNIDEYIKDLKAAIADTDGRCASHHYNLGLALLSKRDFVGAESEFREALRESVHMAEAMVQLGGICLQRATSLSCICSAAIPTRPWLIFPRLSNGIPNSYRPATSLPQPIS